MNIRRFPSAALPRFLPVLAVAFAAILAGCSGTPAASSTTDSIACAQASPCELVVAVEDTGIVDISQEGVTKDDWYEVTVSNDGDNEHTVTLSGYGKSWTVPSLDDRSSVVQFTQAGCFQFASGSSVVELAVYNSDYVDVSQGVATEANPCA